MELLRALNVGSRHSRSPHSGQLLDPLRRIQGCFLLFCFPFLHLFLVRSNSVATPWGSGGASSVVERPACSASPITCASRAAMHHRQEPMRAQARPRRFADPLQSPACVCALWRGSSRHAPYEFVLSVHAVSSGTLALEVDGAHPHPEHQQVAPT